MKKVVFITGASQGLGKYCAIEFASKGYDLFLTARNTVALQIIKSEIIHNYKVKCEIFQLNVTSIEDWNQSKIAFFEHYSQLDILLLNAGVSNPVWFEQFDLQNFRDTYETNIFGVLNGINAFLPHFLQQNKGTIALVSSLADSRGFVGSSSYCSSKIALSYIAESASIELAEKNIKIVNIRPGFVHTNMTAKNKYSMPFIMRPDRAAKIMVNGIEKGKNVVSFPLITNLLTSIIRLLPRFIYQKFINQWKSKQTANNT